MKPIILFITCIITTQISNAQTPNLEWVKSMGGDATGNSIAVDAAGNVYTTGFFSDTVDFDPGPGIFNLIASDPGSDLFISKLDRFGNFVWAKSIKWIGITFPNGSTITLDETGNPYITGNFSGIVDFDPGEGIANLTSAGGYDVFILKLDTSGNFTWAKSMGGVSDDFGASVKVDESENVYTTGSYTGIADFYPGLGTFNLVSDGGNDAFISKLDVAGNFIWAKSIGGSLNDYGSSIALDTSGNVYITGGFKETVDFNPGVGTYNLTCTDTNDAFILKLDSSGNFTWAKNMDGGDVYGYSIAVDAMQNVYTMGNFSRTADFDPGPDTYNLSDYFFGAMYISKLDISGNFLWAKKIGGPEGAIQPISMALDRENNVYTIGEFVESVDFDPGADTFFLTYSSAIGLGMFISKLDSSGNFDWAIDMNGRSSGISIDVDDSYNVYSTGFFFGTTDFDPGSGVTDLTATGTDIFVHKMSQGPTGINEYTGDHNVSIYPNPGNGLFNIVLLKRIDNASIEIYNSMGALIAVKHINANERNTFELTAQSSGLYFVKVISDGKMITSQKIIKE